MEPSSTLIHPGRLPHELALGRYRPLERLGAGGFGVVWRAHDEQLDREVALKRIPLPSSEHAERASREALATARLSHPAIVALYEACADEEAFYLISELVHGRTLAQLIAADELEDEQIFEIGIALAQALAHAHSRGVIHRDIKPHNVLVPGEPHERSAPAKLADFGGARLAGEDALTRTGDVLGTLAYMAPEQCEGLQVGPEADVYSLALVLYEALTGSNPVRGPTPAATARRIGGPIEPLAHRRRDLPRELTETIDAALEPEPRERAPLQELERALEEALRESSGAGRARDGDRSRTRPHARGVALKQAGYDSLPAAEPAERLPAEPATADEPPYRRHRLALPRLAWFAALAGVAAWQAALGRPGASLLALAAGAPLLAGRRMSIGWLGAIAAPALGILGLAGAYPALAGQARRWTQRAGMAALGFWWLALAEPLLARRLWEGPPVGLPARSVWEGSLGVAASHALAAAVTPELAIGMAVWVVAAAVLPWIVRGRSAGLDMAAALTWAVALLATVPLLERGAIAHAIHGSPRGALLGAVLGCALAVGARALRGPVCP